MCNRIITLYSGMLNIMLIQHGELLGKITQCQKLTAYNTRMYITCNN